MGKKQKDKMVRVPLSVLQRASQALDDWTATYAADMCDENAVKRARDRIFEGGGTLSYICEARMPLDDIIKAATP